MCVLYYKFILYITRGAPNEAVKNITITPGECQLYIETANGQSPLSEREGNWSRDASRNGFWGRYRGSVGHPLANFFLIPNNSPRNLYES